MVNEPLWLRSAAIVAALAGLNPEQAKVGFGTEHGETIARTLGKLRAYQDRAARARAVARERALLARQVDFTQEQIEQIAALGALVVASLLYVLPAAEREPFARAFAPSLLRAAALSNTKTPPLACDGAGLRVLLTQVAAKLGRMPEAHQIGAMVLAGLGGDDSRAPAYVHATLRRARVLGIDSASLFAPFAPVVSELRSIL